MVALCMTTWSIFEYNYIKLPSNPGPQAISIIQYHLWIFITAAQGHAHALTLRALLCPGWAESIILSAGSTEIMMLSASAESIILSAGGAESMMLLPAESMMLSVWGHARTLTLRVQARYCLVWAKKMTLAAICLVAGSASFGIRIN